MQRGSFLTNLPETGGGEKIEILSRMAGKNIRVERILTDAPDADVWYDQAWPEWVLIVEGEAELEFDAPSAEEKLAKGDWLLIPAHRRHRVRAATKGTLWLAIHADT